MIFWTEARSQRHFWQSSATLALISHIFQLFLRLVHACDSCVPWDWPLWRNSPIVGVVASRLPKNDEIVYLWLDVFGLVDIDKYLVFALLLDETEATWSCDTDLVYSAWGKFTLVLLFSFSRM